ncbi:hypothetical protein D9611_014402 [Ephemerocybe angulata]|uniref:Cleavage/polyadenylation specificity factor A subunit C-terminal domain-containing protein n=1 Tax=Ephemerocybe angulata TaxID=980116 RepID=A0A8H5AQX4_9AGAR|nr:hypothetical protein D9611_014402 [Tulosesus angulatus]
MSLTAPLFRSELRADPLSRCAALGLPNHSIAILPFYQSQAELDVMDQDSTTRDVPYSPSFILNLASQVDEAIHTVVDFSFLPGFNNPTLAVLYQTEQTWTGRLKEYKDTTKLIIFTLDISLQSYPIITSVEGLPYDALYLVPCTEVFMGVIIVCTNSLLYIDQSSRRIALPVNGWAARTTDLPMGPEPTVDLKLEGSRAIFVDDKTLFLILKDGNLYPVEIGAEGKTVTRLTLGAPLAQTAVPAVVKGLGDGHVFIGSTVGPSVLLKANWVEEEVPEEEEGQGTAVVDTKGQQDWDMDDDLYDDDDDLYGPSKPVESTTTETAVAPKKMRSVLHLSLKDHLPAYGPISGMTFSLTSEGDKPVPELVTATGSGIVGGFTLFQRDLPVRTKKKLLALGGTRGLWSLPIRQSTKGPGGVSVERGVNPFNAGKEGDTCILSTDANPSPGLSRIATKSNSGKSDINFTTRVPGTMVGAAAFFQRTAILVVMTNAIKVLEPDGTERQTILDMDGKLPRPKIRACSISDPFVLIMREDDSLGLFIGETERGKIRRKDMSPMGEKSSKYLAGCFFTDTSGLFESHYQNLAPGGDVATATLQTVLGGGNKAQWLVLVRPQGILEIWTLPKLALAFSSDGISSLHNVLVDSHDPPALSLPLDPPRKPQEFDVEQIVLAPLGEGDVKPHLCVFLRSGQLSVYQAMPLGQVDPTTGPEARRPSHLDIKFVKAASIAFEISRPEEEVSGVLAEHKKIPRVFVPFSTTAPTGAGYCGVFLTGDRPNWIFGTDRGGVKIFPSGHAVVNAFTACSMWERGDFLMYTEDGPRLLEWLPDFSYDYPLPSRSVPRGRSYSNVVFDPSTCLVVAASCNQAKFASYDEDGNRIWEPDAPNVSDPTSDTSALELISPDSWVTMDGFEFASNEYINDIAIVTLETAATETGIKDFIAVGTTIDRGEDLAVKGAAYIFEIVEVVPDAAIAPTRWYKLRLRCRDDAKGPVTAVCGFQGYLVSSMGQKLSFALVHWVCYGTRQLCHPLKCPRSSEIFVRAFDSDERLVGVAFIDVGIYVTSLRSLKNLLLVGDAVKSVMFVAFQEDPYKLVLLAKDVEHHCVTSADFFFTDDGELSIVTGDEEGIIRVYQHNPQDPDSRDGKHLLLRTEFHGQVEYRTSTVIAKRNKDDPSIPQSKLLHGATDGSLFSLTPVEEAAFKRLQLLQGQMTRNVQHTAALNPKAFRIVKNEFNSKPLLKGILDGNLLAHYEALPIATQNEMTQQIGTERQTVLRDWIALSGPW